MLENTYKKIEVIGTSEKSIEDSITNALERAASSLHNVRWFEVQEIRGRFDNGQLQYQTGLKVAFKLDDEK